MPASAIEQKYFLISQAYIALSIAWQKKLKLYHYSTFQAFAMFPLALYELRINNKSPNIQIP
jgi:hypothetical protein